MGTIRIDVELAGLMEVGEARETIPNHTVGGEWVNDPGAVSENRNTILAECSGPVLTVRLLGDLLVLDNGVMTNRRF